MPDDVEHKAASLIAFKIEDGDVVMFRDGARVKSIGTTRPNDEQITRILLRVFEEGRQDKAREIRDVISAR